MRQALFQVLAFSADSYLRFVGDVKLFPRVHKSLFPQFPVWRVLWMISIILSPGGQDFFEVLTQASSLLRFPCLFVVWEMTDLASRFSYLPSSASLLSHRALMVGHSMWLVFEAQDIHVAQLFVVTKWCSGEIHTTKMDFLPSWLHWVVSSALGSPDCPFFTLVLVCIELPGPEELAVILVIHDHSLEVMVLVIWHTYIRTHLWLGIDSRTPLSTLLT